MKKLFFALVLLASLIVACNSEINNESQAKSNEKVANPNGMSELAQLMNDMYDASLSHKKQIKNGEKPEVNIDYEKILTATPTDPSMIAYPEFEPMAKAYINSMKALEESTPEESASAHMVVVSTCKGCHTISCPGPMMRIPKLELPKEFAVE